MVTESKSKLERSIQNYDNPTKSGNAQSSGSQVKQNKEELMKMLEQISKQDARNNVGLLLAMKQIVAQTEHFLDDTKGAVQSSVRSNLSDSILNSARKFSAHLVKYLPNFLSGDSNLFIFLLFIFYYFIFLFLFLFFILILFFLFLIFFDFILNIYFSGLNIY